MSVHGPTWPTATLKFTLVVDQVGKDKKRGIMGSIAKVANADVVLLLDVNKKNGTVTSSRMILHIDAGPSCWDRERLFPETNTREQTR
jgi:hypothetical protein